MIRTRRSNGMTFVEMTLAMAITGIIAAAVATMLFATADAAQNQEAVHGNLVSMERAGQRLDAAIRSSNQILATGNYYVVLWMGDANLDGQPQLSEICRIELNTTTHALTGYQAPSNLLPANNATYNLATTNFNTTTSAIEGTANFPGTLWANNVTTWATSFNNATPTLATLINYQLTFTVNNMSANAVGGAWLHSH